MMPDYEFYTNVYPGESIPAENFNLLARKANIELSAMERKFTVNGTDTDRNLALCAIADYIFTVETISSQILSETSSSVSIGSVSTSHKGPDVQSLGMDLSEKRQQKMFYSLMCKYMGVYRGI